MRTRRALSIVLVLLVSGCDQAGQLTEPESAEFARRNGLEAMISSTGVTMYDLGPVAVVPNLGYAAAVDLNERGEVVGTAAGDLAFRWWKNSFSSLGTLGGRSSQAHAVNASGAIAGTSLPAVGHVEAFIWAGGEMRSLGTLGAYGSWGYGISDAGHVVGQSYTLNGAAHAFLWTDGVMRDIDGRGDSWSKALSVNNRGHAVGWRLIHPPDARPTVARAFLWEDGSMRFLGPEGVYSTASGINDSGAVVGRSSEFGPIRAVMWHDGGVDNLGTLPGDLYSLAFDLNNRGTVVGWSYTSFEAPHAFMWRNGYMTPLGALPGSSASCAYRISENGWVAGLSDSTDGRYHAVLWRLPPQ